MPAIVVDAGGTQLRLAVANDDGRLSDIHREAIPNYVRLGFAQIWDAIADAIERYARDVEERRDSGDTLIAAVPGPVSDRTHLLIAPTIAGGVHQHVPDLREMLTRRTGRRVYLINDVSAAAWSLAEQYDYDRFLVVTVSSGIGSKLVDRNNPQRVFDADPFAGEIGHIVVDTSPDAPDCDCGGRGHLGAIASGRGTERLARSAAGIEGRHITNEHHLVPRALLGDAWSLDIISRAAQPLGAVLAPLIVGGALEKVIVMGGFAQELGTVYRTILDEHLNRFIEASGFPFPRRSYIEVLERGFEPGLAGAAAIFRDRDKLAV